MNISIFGVYDNTVIVDSNLFEDAKVLQNGLSNLNYNFLNVIESLANTYANLSSSTILSEDYDNYKINNNSNNLH